MFDYIEMYRKVKKKANKQGLEWDTTYEAFIEWVHETFMLEDVPPPEWMEVH